VRGTHPLTQSSKQGSIEARGSRRWRWRWLVGWWLWLVAGWWLVGWWLVGGWLVGGWLMGGLVGGGAAVGRNIVALTGRDDPEMRVDITLLRS
jgi:hypothetical protein